MKKTGPGTGNQRRAWTRGKYGKKAVKGKPDPVPPKVAVPAGLAAMRPRDRLDAIHAMQAMLDYKVRQGELVEKAAVEAGHAEMREIVRNDLIGTLPLRLAGDLSGRAHTPAEVRARVLAVVRDIIRGWTKAGIPAEAEQ